VGTGARGLGRPDDAARHYRRALDIWRKVHGDAHYLNAIAISNLASVELEKGRMDGAETMMRDALGRFARSLGEGNSNTGIARLKLCRVLLRRGNFTGAESELLAGLAVLEKQMEPSSQWLATGRKDLAEARQAIARGK
jgi:ATP/maltotriose-dependent transcriptional regulator MalT